MPIYEYKCEKGHTFEAIQRMADDPLTECEECGAAVERVFHPVAVHFKGSGFYTTDYGSKSKAKAGSDGEAKSSEGESSSSSSESKSSGGDSKSSSGSSSGAGEKAAKGSSDGD